MAQRRKGGGPQTKDRRPIKKKTSILTSENIEWIDYKDVNLLRRFMSDRAKIRARRVTGLSAQQQQEVSRAIKLAREMALLHYVHRAVTVRKGGPKRDGDRRGRRGDERREEEATTEASEGAETEATEATGEAVPEEVEA